MRRLPKVEGFAILDDVGQIVATVPADPETHGMFLWDFCPYLKASGVLPFKQAVTAVLQVGLSCTYRCIWRSRNATFTLDPINCGTARVLVRYTLGAPVLSDRRPRAPKAAKPVRKSRR